jgi:hypothetical protein
MGITASLPADNVGPPQRRQVVHDSELQYGVVRNPGRAG